MTTTTTMAENASLAVHQDKKVLTATLVGTAIEWYDFFIYAQAASLIFAPLFFAEVSKSNPMLAQIIAFATVGISFLFRPLGAIVCGRLGDKYGRKMVLVTTLILMGASTTLIGFLPTYAQIGVLAPLALVFLRIVQGFSAGGEWGGAALLSVEHAPLDKRSLFGAYPQIGVPIGMILATGVLLLLNLILGKEAYLEWGWRIPFILSIALIIVGTFIRRSVKESPVFEAMHRRKAEASAPLSLLFKDHTPTVLKAALIFMGVNAGGYILIAFMVGYGQKVLGLSPTLTMLIVVAAAFSWLVSTLWGGILGDKIGRLKIFKLGYILLSLWSIPMWFLIDTKSPILFMLALVVWTIPLGFTYGPLSALFAEMFPAKVRFSGVSISYALGSIIGGAFAPMIAQWIMATYQQSWMIGLYITIVSLISLFTLYTIKKDPQGVDLSL